MATPIEPRPDSLGGENNHNDPNADLKKLIIWMNRHDGEWLADALWLRYVKIAPVFYRAHALYGFHGIQTLNVSSEKLRNKLPQAPCNPGQMGPPPLPFTILPETPPSNNVDRLGALPHDVRFEILSYLFFPRANYKPPPGNPIFKTDRSMKLLFDEKPEEGYTRSTLLYTVDGSAITSGQEIYSLTSQCTDEQSEKRKPGIGGKDLNRMALVSRCWRDQVDAFCSHALVVWKQKVSTTFRETGGYEWEHYDQENGWASWDQLDTFTSCARMELVYRARKYCALCGTRCYESCRRLAPGLPICATGCRRKS